MMKVKNWKLNEFLLPQPIDDDEYKSELEEIAWRKYSYYRKYVVHICIRDGEFQSLYFLDYLHYVFLHYVSHH